MGWSSLTDYLVDLANAAVTGGPVTANLRTAVTSPVTIVATDYTVLTDLTVAGAVAVTLPAGTNEKIIIIVDGKGDAATNNITITPNGAETINGAATYVINENRAAVMLQYSTVGTKWNILANYAAGDVTRTSFDQGANRLQNKDLSDDSVKFVDNADTTKTLNFSLGGATSGADVTFASVATADRVMTLFDATDTFVGKATTDILTNKSIDGDTNTLTDVAISSLKTVLGDADEAIVRDAAGAVVSAKIVNANVDAAAGIAATKLADGSVDNTEFQRLGTAGTAGAGNLVTTDGTQDITNKDIDGGTASDDLRITLPKNTTTNLNALTRKEATIVYDTDLDKPYYDNGTALVAFGSGSGGSGEINVISNPSAQDAITGWVASGAGITVARTTTVAELPLDSVTTTGIKVDPVSGTDYVYYRWTMPAALKQRKLKWEWWQRPESGYASGDLKVEIYKNAASNYGGAYTEFNLSTDSSGTTSIPNQTGKFTTTFDADDGDYYELRIVRVAGTSFMVFANEVIGPGVQPQGAVVSDSVSITPTFSALGTVTNTSFKYERIGQWMHLHGITTPGTPAASTASLDLPSGFTIDYSAMHTQTNLVRVGRFEFATSASTSISSGNLESLLFCDGTDTNSVFITRNSASNVFTKQNGSSIFVSGESISFDIWLPIAEWAGSGTVNVSQNDVEYASVGGTWDADSSTTVYGPSGVAMTGALTSNRTKTLTWQTPTQSGDEIVPEFAYDANPSAWFPLSSLAPRSLSSSGTDATSAGFYITSGGSATTSVIVFNRYLNIANDDTPTSDWSTSYRWRLKKVKAGVAVGFGAASESSLGLIKLPSTMIRLSGGSGYGSTNTRIRRFTTTISSVGTDITYADSATLGGTFTINASGIYAITYTDSDSGSGATTIGISLNSTQLTTNITSITNADILLRNKDTASTGPTFSVVGTFRLSSGDVIRAHTDGQLDGSSDQGVRFVITQIVKL